MLCAAPDTFLGAGIQTARAIVDSGIVGDITSCVAVLQRDAGLLAEKFPYTIAQGGGIGIDVGIYYATALLSILGPAKKVCGMSQTVSTRTHALLYLARPFWRVIYHHGRNTSGRDGSVRERRGGQFPL